MTPTRTPDHEIATYKHPWLDEPRYVMCVTMEYEFDGYEKRPNGVSGPRRWRTIVTVLYGTACGRCHGDAESTCSECDGTGEHECDCGHQHECGQCEGTGKQTCADCDGDGIDREVDVDDLPPDARAAFGVATERILPDPNQLSMFPTEKEAP